MEKALTLVPFFFLVKHQGNFSYHYCFYLMIVLSVVGVNLFEHCRLLNLRQSDTKWG